jgi:hypothetical protein
MVAMAQEAEAGSLIRVTFPLCSLVASLRSSALPLWQRQSKGRAPSLGLGERPYF